MNRRGRPKIDYVGRTFGLVTVLRRDNDKFWCRCECGGLRYVRQQNLLSSPPKGYSRCVDQYELRFEERAA